MDLLGGQLVDLASSQTEQSAAAHVERLQLVGRQVAPYCSRERPKRAVVRDALQLAGSQVARLPASNLPKLRNIERPYELDVRTLLGRKRFNRRDAIVRLLERQRLKLDRGGTQQLPDLERFGTELSSLKTAMATAGRLAAKKREGGNREQSRSAIGHRRSSVRAESAAGMPLVSFRM